MERFLIPGMTTAGDINSILSFKDIPSPPSTDLQDYSWLPVQLACLPTRSNFMKSRPCKNMYLLAIFFSVVIKEKITTLTG
jgi:hypothetical protein